MKEGKANTAKFLLPVWGIALYILLYLWAASIYPGGSDYDKTASGFSWKHNYWCELMASVAQNGEANTSRTVAITAMFVLAISLGLFWANSVCLFPAKKAGNKVMQFCGIISMCALPLFFTGEHDLTINIAGLFGIIAIIILLVKLVRYKMLGLFYLGILCFLLCGLNNYIYYYNTSLMGHLAVIQKITFVAFLTWFVLLAIQSKKNYLSR